MMNTKDSTKKKLLAQALGITVVAVLGLLAGEGTAAADGQGVVNPDGTWGAADGAEQRGVDIVPAVHAIDTSPTVPGYKTPVSSYPAGSSYPAASSHPAAPSWPGRGFGVADN